MNGSHERTAVMRCVVSRTCSYCLLSSPLDAADELRQVAEVIDGLGKGRHEDGPDERPPVIVLAMCMRFVERLWVTFQIFHRRSARSCADSF